MTPENKFKDQKNDLPEVIEIKPRAKLPLKVPGQNIFINTLNVVASPARPLVQRYHRRWQKSRHHFVLDSLLLLIILALIAVNIFFVYRYRNLIAGDRDVALAIEMPTPIKSGQEVSLDIIYSNKKIHNLNATKINVVYPRGFIFSQAIPSPVPNTDNQWDLGSVERGEVGVIKITGRLIGEVALGDRFTSFLSFHVGSSYRLSQQVAIKKYLVTSSFFTLDLVAPEAVLEKYQENYSLNYSYQGEGKSQPIKVTLQLPADFRLATASEGLVDNAYWLLGELSSQLNGELTFQGSFNAGTQSPQVIPATLSLERNGVWFNQVGDKKEIALLKPAVQLTQSVDQAVASWGDKLDYQVKLVNTGNSSLTDLTLTALTDLNYFDLTHSSLAGGTAANGKIIWSPSQVSALQTLQPGEQQTLNYSLKLRSSPLDQDRPEVNNRLEIKNAKTGESVRGIYLGESNTVAVKINSRLSLLAVGRYYGSSGEQFGFGPVPPKVNFPTSYRIFWQVGNSSNPVKQARVTATLPGGVKWLGLTSLTAGSGIDYNEATRVVTWAIGSIPPGAKLNSGDYQASFLLEITPNAKQKGLILPLVNQVNFTAVDEFTNSSLTAQAGGITTDLPGDPRVSGRGRVVK